MKANVKNGILKYMIIQRTMNLTKANIKALRKVTVKIECSNNNKGSGIIVSVGENLYVLTAAHIIQKIPRMAL